MNRIPRVPGVRLSGGWLGWLAFVAVFAVAAAGVASGPIFLESVGDALADEALTQGPAVDAIVRARSDVDSFDDDFRTAGAVFESALAGVDLLEPGPTTYAVGGRRTTAVRDDRFIRSQVRLVARDGALDALDVIERGSSPGIWIGERVAEALGVGPGDTITITDPEFRLEAPVEGIYGDFDLDNLGPYWSLLPGELLPQEQRVFGLIEPELLIAGEDVFFRLTGGLAEEGTTGSSISLGVEDFPPLSGRVWWQTMPFAGGTGSELRRLASDLRRLQTDANDPTVSPGAELFGAGLPRVLLESDLLDLADRVARAQTQIEPAVFSVEITVALLGLAVIGLGGWFVARRRRVELRMWAIEGRGPLDLGWRSLLGAIPAAVVGAVIGSLGAPFVVRALGPSAALHREAVPLPALALFVIGGLTLVGAVSGLVVLRVLDIRPHAGRLRWVWDLALYGVALTLLVQLLVRDPVDPASGEVDLGAMLFPVVGVGAVVAVGLRLVALGAARLRRAGRSLPTPVFLAWRRMVAAAAGSLGVVLPIGVAAGVAVFASALVVSLNDALDAKAVVSVGSDVSVQFARTAVDEQLPEGFSLVRLGTASTEGREPVLLVMIDADSYPEATPWYPVFGMELDEVLGLLAPGPEARIPAIVAGPRAAALPEEGVRRTQSLTIAYEVVGRLEAVPLMAPDRPTLVVRRDAVVAWAIANPAISGLDGLPAVAGAAPDPGDLFLGLLARLVSTRDPAAMTEFLESIGHPTNLVEARDDALAAASFTAPRWAFDYLRLLAYVAMVLAIGVFAFSVAEGRRRMVLAHALTRRMGVGGVAAAGGMAVEVFALIGLAAILGMLAAAGLAVAVIGEFDPLPGLFPALQATTPLMDFVLVSVVAFGAGLFVWLITHRAASRADVAEALRVG